MKDYGNTFNATKVDPISVERMSVWKSAREFFPGGAAFDKPTSSETLGTIIPAGTPIFVDKPGGKPTLNGDTPIGLTYEDVEMGSNGCTFTIVTQGEILVSRVNATISSTQESYLFGRISFIKD